MPMLERSKEEIELAFESFAEKCDILLQDYREEHFPTLPDVRVVVYPGRIYWKLVKEEESSGASVFGFVRKSDGAIFKAATWKAPFVKGPSAVRGYVNDPNNGMSSVTPYGVVYAK